MIVPMKKVSLVVMDKTREESLKKLREAGVVHLEQKNVSSEALTKLLDRKGKIENALGILRPFEAEAKAAEKKGKKNPPPASGQYSPQSHPQRRASDFVNSEGVPYSSEAVNAPDRKDFTAQVLEFAEEQKGFQDRLASLVRERSRIEGWGNFDPRDFAFLAEKGLVFIPYEFNPRTFAGLPEDTRFVMVNQDKTAVRVLVLDREVPGETPFVLPEHSLKEIDASLAETRDETVAIERQLAALARRTSVIEEEQKELLQQIEFETARSGMELLEDAPPESTVAWITGFVPQEDLGILKRASAENGWAMIADDPGPDDPVPTKLKNNRFVELLNPLTGFLEVLPGYREIDISLWFLFFFVIFFGMIFGDAGYGSLLLLGGIIGLVKTVKKGVPPAVKLLLLLGFSNFLWGLLTCSWFAIEVSRLPAFLRNISLPLISSASDLDPQLVQQNLMIFCFSLALLQLSIGHVLAALHNKSLKALGDIGAVAMLTGMYFIILSLIASNEARQIPLFPQAIYVFAAGFALNFVFANYDGNVGRSILESLKNIISVILGIANVFSDIMSYIRLWAVGLAGAAIASTVNAMAGPMLGHFLLFIFGVTLLVFGHGLNLVLNMLSVLVHGVRLNTLEFSGHAGLTWAGIAYRPFAKRIKKEAQSA